MSKRILVVDDNEDILLILQTILDNNGFSVRTAAGGRAALARLAEDIPDAILLDIMMPDMNGLEVLAHIRSSEATARVPVILVTAKTHDDDLLRGYQLGADYYITKPCTAGQLLYGLEIVLRRSSRAADGDAGGTGSTDPDDAGVT